MWLLFDADNTLLDFTKASKDSIWETFQNYDLEITEEIHQVYKKINTKIWQEFEQEQITAIELRQQRFGRLFDVLGWTGIDSYDFNTRYLENLVLVSEAYDGVHDLIESLKKNHQVSIVTNGLKEVQRPRLRKLNLYDCFDSIVVSDEIGVAKPQVGFFEHAYASIPNPPSKSDMIVIGDNLHSDILGGINYGIKTCWISHGKPNDTDIQPDYVVETVLDFPKIIC